MAGPVEERLAAYRLLIADVYELAGSSRRNSERLAREAGHTAAQWHVMSAVSDHAAAVPAIARRLGLTRQSVQRVVDELVAAGSLELLPNPAHARSPLAGLTTQGREVLAGLFARSDAARQRLLATADVEATDLVAARRVVRALATALADDDVT